MLRNYLKIAYRQLKRRPGYAAINVGGLALGLACCILIALYARDELSYDDFHAKGDRVLFVGAGSPADRSGMATPFPLAEALRQEAPSTERAFHAFWPGDGQVSRDGESFSPEANIYHAEAGFFETFSFPLLQGKAALSEPNTAVISEALAAKHFPDESPLGQMLTFKDVRGGEQAYRVTGVAQSRSNSYLDFSAVLSFPSLDYAESHGDSWRSLMFLTFALLEDGATLDAFRQQAAAIAEQHYEEDDDTAFFGMPMSELYLSELVTPEGFRGNWAYIYLFGAIAAFILLLAVVNYVNLATARSAQRAKEVGVRRTVGAGRGQVARQFLGESVLLALAAFVVALVMAQAALPAFNALFDKHLSLVGAGVGFLLLLFGVTLGVGLLAGAYPALYLSGFEPTSVLRGVFGSGKGEGRLRKGLVVVQFVVAVALIAATAVVYQQLGYAQQKELGFEDEQVVSVSLGGERDQAAAVKRAFTRHSGDLSATASSGAPGHYRMRYGFVPDSTHPDEHMMAYVNFADTDYLETLGINMKQGRFFRQRRASDSSAYVINEAAARELGWADPVGRELPLMGGGRIVGVMVDYHFASMREKIGPVVLRRQRPASHSYSSYNSIAVRFRPGQTAAVLDHLKKQWARFSEEPLEYDFLDDTFAEMYRTERRLGQVFSAFALIAILIACLGLFGLAAYAAERRTKEIGIRKTFGASAEHIVGLLSKDFAKLVGIAFVVAAPVAWYAMSRWLQSFAYRVELSPWLFAAAGAAALLIALLTVSYHALRAAWANPTDALRYE